MSSTGTRRLGLRGFSRRLPIGVLVLALVALAPAPGAHAAGAASLTATPATNLVDLQTVQVQGSGFPAGHLIVLGLCLASATDASGCDPNGIGDAFADTNGAFSKTITVLRDITLNPGGPSPLLVDCLTTPCAVGATDGSVHVPGPLTTTNIAFADPHVSVTIDPAGTLEATTNLATASAVVSCTVRTPVSLLGMVTQPLSDPGHTGVQGAFPVPEFPSNSSVREYCAPGSPLHAFIPTRYFNYQHQQFVLGNAAVEIDAQPFAFFGVDQATVVANRTIPLFDYDAVVSVLRTAIANPSNTALRASLLADIQTRLTQDSTFRSEWLSALGH